MKFYDYDCARIVQLVSQLCTPEKALWLSKVHIFSCVTHQTVLQQTYVDI